MQSTKLKNYNRVDERASQHEMFFMLPTKEINGFIRYLLAKAKDTYGKNIELYAFIFMSNHFHFLLKDPEGELPRFMSYFQGNLAREINRHIGRKGKFWSREYHDLILDTDPIIETVGSADVFWDRYCYTTLNAVKSGLVDTGSQWGGVSSLSHAFDNSPVVGTGLNRTAYGEKKRHNKNVNKEDFMETFSFALNL